MCAASETRAQIHTERLKIDVKMEIYRFGNSFREVNEECIPAEHWTVFTFIIDKCLFITCGQERKKKPPVLYLTWSCVDLKRHKLDFCPCAPGQHCGCESGKFRLWFLWSINRSYREQSHKLMPPPQRRKEPNLIRGSSCIWFARTGPMWPSMFSLFKSNFQLHVSI